MGLVAGWGCRVALGRPVDLFSIREFDSAMGTSLETLQASHRAWLKGNKSVPMTVDGAPIEDLCLTFELPGEPSPYCSSPSCRHALLRLFHGNWLTQVSFRLQVIPTTSWFLAAARLR